MTIEEQSATESVAANRSPAGGPAPAGLLPSGPLPNAPAPRRNVFRRMYDWVLSWADTPYGTPALAAISFAESSFFPIPPDVLQIALSVSKPQRSFFYAAVSAAASVAGGVLGWVIGAALWHAVGDFFFAHIPGFTPENFELVREKYRENAFIAIFAAAFTPIPFKVFTIAAGVFDVSLGVLLIASALGRSARFFLVAATIRIFGPTVRELLERYFELATVVLGVLLIAGFLAIKWLL
ncbi:MAG: cytochrome B [Planctomycetota bacterium]|nr:MAG: cytochrome B [Planctomycetota bacterium]